LDSLEERLGKTKSSRSLLSFPCIPPTQDGREPVSITIALVLVIRAKSMPTRQTEEKFCGVSGKQVRIGRNNRARTKLGRILKKKTLPGRNQFSKTELGIARDFSDRKNLDQTI
jgi:hypothetical protein